MWLEQFDKCPCQRERGTVSFLLAFIVAAMAVVRAMCGFAVGQRRFEFVELLSAGIGWSGHAADRSLEIRYILSCQMIKSMAPCKQFGFSTVVRAKSSIPTDPLPRQSDEFDSLAVRK